MRIAIFTETYLPYTDGVVTRLLRTLEELQKLAVDVLVLAPDGGPAEYAGARVEGFPGRPFYLYPDKRVIWPRTRMFDLLHAFQPDLIHTVNPAVFGMGAIVASRVIGVPLVASYHTNFGHYARLYGFGWLAPGIWGYMRLLHNRAAVNLCTSNSTMQELRRRGFRRLRLWPEAVDRSFRPLPPDPDMRNRLTAGHPERTLLLYVGRLAAEKQLERLLPFLGADPHVTLALVGGGPREAELRQAFAGTTAVFAGYLHGDDLVAAYNAADAFVFPSTTETLGLVLLEAMACGLPVLAASSAPTRDLLRDGGGMLYDADRPDALAEALTALREQSGLADRLRREARHRGARQGWDAATRALLSHYREALGAGDAAPGIGALSHGSGIGGG